MKKSQKIATLLLPIAMGFTVSMAEPSLAGSLKDAAEDNVSAAFWQGSDFTNRANSFWFGGSVALNRDLTSSGFVLRADGEYDGYSYFQSANNLGKVNGTEWQGDAMLGYQVAYHSFAAALYAGVDVRSDRLSPLDLENSVRGQQVGAKFDAEFETERELPYYASFDGFYSTAFQSYWARLRGGAKIAKSFGSHLSQVFVGPEGYVLGNQESNAQRVGGFVNFALDGLFPRTLEITLSGGYQFADEHNNNYNSIGAVTGTTGGPGAYGLLEFKFCFNAF